MSINSFTLWVGLCRRIRFSSTIQEFDDSSTDHVSMQNYMMGIWESNNSSHLAGR